jgi:hypothetical protein
MVVALWGRREAAVAEKDQLVVVTRSVIHRPARVRVTVERGVAETQMEVIVMKLLLDSRVDETHTSVGLEGSWRAPEARNDVEPGVRCVGAPPGTDTFAVLTMLTSGPSRLYDRTVVVLASEMKSLPCVHSPRAPENRMAAARRFGSVTFILLSRQSWARWLTRSFARHDRVLDAKFVRWWTMDGGLMNTYLSPAVQVGLSTRHMA